MDTLRRTPDHAREQRVGAGFDEVLFDAEPLRAVTEVVRSRLALFQRGARAAAE